jgi:hypothetical protein
MKFKKIVGFGDSWVWGDELIDPALQQDPDAHSVMHENTVYRESHCFLGLIGQHYGVPVENFGIPGGSMQSSMWTYLWWLEHEQLDPRECLILVGLTAAARTTFYNPKHISYGNDPPWNRFVHDAWIRSGAMSDRSDWVNLVKLYNVLTDCSKSRALNRRQTVTFFEGQYYKFGGNVLQFNTLAPDTVMTAEGLVWENSALENFVKNRPDLLAPNRHPNEHGHEFIRDLLITEIDRVILAEC